MSKNIGCTKNIERVRGWMGKEYRVYGGKPIERSWGKNVKTMWSHCGVLILSFRQWKSHQNGKK